jgi:hypothetical protein
VRLGFRGLDYQKEFRPQVSAAFVWYSNHHLYTEPFEYHTEVDDPNTRLVCFKILPVLHEGNLVEVDKKFIFLYIFNENLPTNIPEIGKHNFS